jgi:TatD DNase family protein
MPCGEIKMIDTHTHLDKINRDEIGAVIERALKVNITTIVTVGMDPVTSHQGIKLAQDYSEVYAAVGIHPWEAAANASPEAFASIRELAQSERVVAIGEIGLDFENNAFTGESYQPEPARRIQRAVFRQQLQLAKELEIPAIIHVRQSQAHQEAAAAIVELKLTGGVIIQLVSATKKDIEAYLSADCYISVGGVPTDPREADLRLAVQAVPLERMVLETDAPYVPPIWKLGLPSEPADIPAVGTYIAALKGVPVSDLYESTTKNAQQLFHLP